jgi:hypothetical protein
MAFEKLKHLEKLDISHTKVTDKAFDYIKSAKNIKYLNITNCIKLKD